jgi:hypothetical protein
LEPYDVLVLDKLVGPEVIGLTVRALHTPEVVVVGPLAVLVSFVICIAVIITYLSAIRAASSIKDGAGHRLFEKPAVDIRYRSFSGSAGQVTEPNLKLIGATQKAVFFYDVDEKRTIVIPQAQIVSIEIPE